MDKNIQTSTFIHKMRLIFISFLIFISAISNIASATFSLVIIEDFTDPNSPVKSITAIEKDERIFVKIHLYTIPDEVSEGVEKMRFHVSVEDKYLLYEFCSEKRVDQVISFSFPKCDLEKISGKIEMLHTKEELSDAVTYYVFSIEQKFWGSGSLLVVYWEVAIEIKHAKSLPDTKVPSCFTEREEESQRRMDGSRLQEMSVV